MLSPGKIQTEKASSFRVLLVYKSLISCDYVPDPFRPTSILLLLVPRSADVAPNGYYGVVHQVMTEDPNQASR